MRACAPRHRPAAGSPDKAPRTEINPTPNLTAQRTLSGVGVNTQMVALDSDPADAAALACSRDDPEAFVLVFERHFDAVFRFLRRRVGSDRAEDLAAEVFVQAFRGRLSYDTARADARPWLYGIAANLLGRHYREEERQLRAYARTGVDPLAQDGRVPAGVEAAWVDLELAAALAALPHLERETLLLHAWAELDPAEIAEALGVPAATVRTRLHRARRRLRERLAPHPRIRERSEHD